MDIIPSHLGGERHDGGMFSNVLLRIGEVQAVYYPDDPHNVSRRFTEYKVWVQHRGGGTAVAKMYDHVACWDLFGGLADSFTATYRADPAAARRVGGQPIQGTGSKVLLLCINGENQNAVIIGGFRDSKATPDDPELGHHLRFKFNGVDVSIDQEGALTLGVAGATDNEGKPVKDPVGTTIKIGVDGEVSIDAKKAIRLGSEADQPMVLGNEWLDFMGKLIDAIMNIIVFTSMGNSSKPLNAADFIQLKSELQNVLSKLVFGKKES